MKWFRIWLPSIGARPEYEGVVFSNGMTVVVNIGLKVLGMEVFPTEEAMRQNYSACRFTWLAGPPHPQEENTER